MPEIHSCSSATLAQIVADDFYLKFITETLEALGDERSKKVLSRLQISQSIRGVEAQAKYLKEKLSFDQIPSYPKLPSKFNRFKEIEKVLGFTEEP